MVTWSSSEMRAPWIDRSRTTQSMVDSELERGHEALAHLRDRLGRDHAIDQVDEFIAAEATERVGRARRHHQPAAEGLEGLVPDGMPVDIVDLPEIIDVHLEQREA